MIPWKTILSATAVLAVAVLVNLFADVIDRQLNACGTGIYVDGSCKCVHPYKGAHCEIVDCGYGELVDSVWDVDSVTTPYGDVPSGCKCESQYWGFNCNNCTSMFQQGCTGACRSGYFGPRCDVMCKEGTEHDMEGVLHESSGGVYNYYVSGRGMCLTDGSVLCDKGTAGLDCSIDCKDCKYGNCNSLTGECDCFAGVAGELCDQECPGRCSGNKGVCRWDGELATCECAIKHTGPDCSLDCCARGNRTTLGVTHGDCAVNVGGCICDEGWAGDDCDCHPEKTCGGRGACLPSGACECDRDFQGRNCEMCADDRIGPFCQYDRYSCPDNPGHGEVVALNSRGDYGCKCNAGFTGEFCDECTESAYPKMGYRMCEFVIPDTMCHNGRVNSGYAGVGVMCICDGNFSAASDCAGCKLHYYGPECDVRCDEQCFESGGTCVHAPEPGCLCPKGMRAVDGRCQICGGDGGCLNGECYGGRCECDAGWYGDNCDISAPQYRGRTCNGANGVPLVRKEKASCNTAADCTDTKNLNIANAQVALRAQKYGRTMFCYRSDVPASLRDAVGCCVDANADGKCDLEHLLDGEDECDSFGGELVEDICDSRVLEGEVNVFEWCLSKERGCTKNGTCADPDFCRDRCDAGLTPAQWRVRWETDHVDSMETLMSEPWRFSLDDFDNVFEDPFPYRAAYVNASLEEVCAIDDHYDVCLDHLTPRDSDIYDLDRKYVNGQWIPMPSYDRCEFTKHMKELDVDGNRTVVFPAIYVGWMKMISDPESTIAFGRLGESEEAYFGEVNAVIDRVTLFGRGTVELVMYNYTDDTCEEFLMRSAADFSDCRRVTFFEMDYRWGAFCKWLSSELEPVSGFEERCYDQSRVCAGCEDFQEGCEGLPLQQLPMPAPCATGWDGFCSVYMDTERNVQGTCAYSECECDGYGIGGVSCGLSCPVPRFTGTERPCGEGESVPWGVCTPDKGVVAFGYEQGVCQCFNGGSPADGCARVCQEDEDCSSDVDTPVTVETMECDYANVAAIEGSGWSISDDLLIYFTDVEGYNRSACGAEVVDEDADGVCLKGPFCESNVTYSAEQHVDQCADGIDVHIYGDDPTAAFYMSPDEHCQHGVVMNLSTVVNTSVDSRRLTHDNSDGIYSYSASSVSSDDIVEAAKTACDDMVGCLQFRVLEVDNTVQFFDTLCPLEDSTGEMNGDLYVKNSPGSGVTSRMLTSEVVANYGYSQIEACVGDTVRVVWSDYHNLQETNGADCSSGDIGVDIVGYYSRGHEQIFSNDELSAAPGETRYFKCDSHCGQNNARIEVSCPSAPDAQSSPSPSSPVESVEESASPPSPSPSQPVENTEGSGTGDSGGYTKLSNKICSSHDSSTIIGHGDYAGSISTASIINSGFTLTTVSHSDDSPVSSSYIPDTCAEACVGFDFYSTGVNESVACICYNSSCESVSPGGEMWRYYNTPPNPGETASQRADACFEACRDRDDVGNDFTWVENLTVSGFVVHPETGHCGCAHRLAECAGGDYRGYHMRGPRCMPRPRHLELTETDAVGEDRLYWASPLGTIKCTILLPDSMCNFWRGKCECSQPFTTLAISGAPVHFNPHNSYRVALMQGYDIREYIPFMVYQSKVPSIVVRVAQDRFCVNEYRDFVVDGYTCTSCLGKDEFVNIDVHVDAHGRRCKDYTSDTCGTADVRSKYVKLSSGYCATSSFLNKTLDWQDPYSDVEKCEAAGNAYGLNGTQKIVYSTTYKGCLYDGTETKIYRYVPADYVGRGACSPSWKDYSGVSDVTLYDCFQHCAPQGASSMSYREDTRDCLCHRTCEGDNHTGSAVYKRYDLRWDDYVIFPTGNGYCSDWREMHAEIGLPESPGEKFNPFTCMLRCKSDSPWAGLGEPEYFSVREDTGGCICHSSCNATGDASGDASGEEEEVYVRYEYTAQLSAIHTQGRECGYDGHDCFCVVADGTELDVFNSSRDCRACGGGEQAFISSVFKKNDDQCYCSAHDGACDIVKQGWDHYVERELTYFRNGNGVCQVHLSRDLVSSSLEDRLSECATFCEQKTQYDGFGLSLDDCMCTALDCSPLNRTMPEYETFEFRSRSQVSNDDLFDLYESASPDLRCFKDLDHSEEVSCDWIRALKHFARGTSYRAGDCSVLAPGADETYQVPCSGHGFSSSGTCACDYAEEFNVRSSGAGLTFEAPTLRQTPFRGKKCNVMCPGYDMRTMESVCSNHGLCQSDGRCDCEQGFTGSDCSLACETSPGSLTCSGHGTCDEREQVHRYDIVQQLKAMQCKDETAHLKQDTVIQKGDRVYYMAKELRTTMTYVFNTVDGTYEKRPTTIDDYYLSGAAVRKPYGSDATYSANEEHGEMRVPFMPCEDTIDVVRETYTSPFYDVRKEDVVLSCNVKYGDHESGYNIYCGMCTCEESSSTGNWTGYDCRTPSLGFLGQSARQTCPGMTRDKKPCNGGGTCTWGSVNGEGVDVYKSAQCFCGDVSDEANYSTAPRNHDGDMLIHVSSFGGELYQDAIEFVTMDSGVLEPSERTCHYPRREPYHELQQCGDYCVKNYPASCFTFHSDTSIDLLTEGILCDETGLAFESEAAATAEECADACGAHLRNGSLGSDVTLAGTGPLACDEDAGTSRCAIELPKGVREISGVSVTVKQGFESSLGEFSIEWTDQTSEFGTLLKRVEPNKFCDSMASPGDYVRHEQISSAEECAEACGADAYGGLLGTVEFPLTHYASWRDSGADPNVCYCHKNAACDQLKDDAEWTLVEMQTTTRRWRACATHFPSPSSWESAPTKQFLCSASSQENLHAVRIVKSTQDGPMHLEKMEVQQPILKNGAVTHYASWRSATDGACFCHTLDSQCSTTTSSHADYDFLKIISDSSCLCCQEECSEDFQAEHIVIFSDTCETYDEHTRHTGYAVNLISENFWCPSHALSYDAEEYASCPLLCPPETVRFTHTDPEHKCYCHVSAQVDDCEDKLDPVNKYDLYDMTPMQTQRGSSFKQYHAITSGNTNHDANRCADIAEKVSIPPGGAVTEIGVQNRCLVQNGKVVENVWYDQLALIQAGTDLTNSLPCTTTTGCVCVAASSSQTKGKVYDVLCAEGLKLPDEEECVRLGGEFSTICLKNDMPICVAGQSSLTNYRSDCSCRFGYSGKRCDRERMMCLFSGEETVEGDRCVCSNADGASHKMSEFGCCPVGTYFQQKRYSSFTPLNDFIPLDNNPFYTEALLQVCQPAPTVVQFASTRDKVLAIHNYVTSVDEVQLVRSVPCTSPTTASMYAYQERYLGYSGSTVPSLVIDRANKADQVVVCMHHCSKTRTEDGLGHKGFTVLVDDLEVKKTQANANGHIMCDDNNIRIRTFSGDTGTHANPGDTYEEKLRFCIDSCVGDSQLVDTEGASNHDVNLWSQYSGDDMTQISMRTDGRCYCSPLTPLDEDGECERGTKTSTYTGYSYYVVNRQTADCHCEKEPAHTETIVRLRDSIRSPFKRFDMLYPNTEINADCLEDVRQQQYKHVDRFGENEFSKQTGLRSFVTPRPVLSDEPPFAPDSVADSVTDCFSACQAQNADGFTFNAANGCMCVNSLKEDDDPYVEVSGSDPIILKSGAYTEHDIEAQGVDEAASACHETCAGEYPGFGVGFDSICESPGPSLAPSWDSITGIRGCDAARQPDGDIVPAYCDGTSDAEGYTDQMRSFFTTCCEYASTPYERCTGKWKCYCMTELQDRDAPPDANDANDANILYASGNEYSVTPVVYAFSEMDYRNTVIHVSSTDELYINPYVCNVASHLNYGSIPGKSCNCPIWDYQEMYLEYDYVQIGVGFCLPDKKITGVTLQECGIRCTEDPSCVAFSAVGDTTCILSNNGCDDDGEWTTSSDDWKRYSWQATEASKGRCCRTGEQVQYSADASDELANLHSCVQACTEAGKKTARPFLGGDGFKCYCSDFAYDQQSCADFETTCGSTQYRVLRSKIRKYTDLGPGVCTRNTYAPNGQDYVGGTVTLKHCQDMCTSDSKCVAAMYHDTVGDKRCMLSDNCAYAIDASSGWNTYAQNDERTDDETCACSGSFINNGNLVSCPAGKYMPEGSACESSCKNCETGTFSDEGDVECRACPAGKIQTGPTVCSECPQGLSSRSGDHSCTPCLSGKFSLAGGLCTICPSGYFQESDAAGSCEACAQGKFSTPGAATCTLCEQGKFSIRLAAEACEPCGTGRYNDEQGAWKSSFCKDCSPGKFSTLEVTASCKDCPVGYSSDLNYYTDTAPATDMCSECAAGRYQDEEGGAVCKDCQAGRMQYVQGAVSCQLCPKGYYQELTGETSCEWCTAGKYADQTGRTSCKTCGYLLSDVIPLLSNYVWVDRPFPRTSFTEACDQYKACTVDTPGLPACPNTKFAYRAPSGFGSFVRTCCWYDSFISGGTCQYFASRGENQDFYGSGVRYEGLISSFQDVLKFGNARVCIPTISGWDENKNYNT